MSQSHNFTSPSRRGTPSTNEPIPYFNGDGSNNTSTGETGFYSTIGLTSTATYQQTTFTAQQQQPSMQHLPYGVPPRCATGPAVETPHQSYAHSVGNPYAMASRIDPYRSASVVYGSSNNAYGQFPVSAGAAATKWAPSDGSFFDQFANTGHDSSNFTAASVAPMDTANPHHFQAHGDYVNSISYSEQYAAVATYGETAYTAAAASIGAVDSMAVNGQNVELANAEDTGANNNGVVFDQASGQYYDMNSGQYYDEVSGMWYYPDQLQNPGATFDKAEAKAQAATQAPNIASPEPVSQDNDATFFDNLASVLPPASG
ncbi:hypothetical protein IWW36_005527, partial [Coemansia brasiliensis]